MLRRVRCQPLYVSFALMGACGSASADAIHTPLFGDSSTAVAPVNDAGAGDDAGAVQLASAVRPIATSAATTSIESPRSPLRDEGPFVALPVPGFRNAVVSVPTGATSPRPILVAMHGNFDRPEWQCETWREISDSFPFILCPRGVLRRDAPNQDRWEYAYPGLTERELLAGLSALRERYPNYIAPGPVLFAGFSLGAIMGLGILLRHPAEFGPIVLVEGGNEHWTAATVRNLTSRDDTGASTLRILFACSQTDCTTKSNVASHVVVRAGGTARVVSGSKVGHTYDGPVAAAIKREWAWLIAGDPRWHQD